MNPAIGLFVGLTLFSTMLALGLGLRSEALGQWFRQPDLPLRILIGSCLLVPLLALLLLQTPWGGQLSTPARYAIALMGLCPSAPLALRKARRLGADHQLTALVQVAAALAAIGTVPMLGMAFRNSFGVSGWQIHPLDVALQVGRVQVLPLLLGLGLRHRWPTLAERLEAPLTRLAQGLLLTLLALVLIKSAPLLLRFVPANLPALPLMAVMAALALLIGRSMAAGSPEHGVAAGLVTAMRNPGLALLLADRHGQDVAGLRLAILLHVLVTVVVSAVWLRLEKPRSSAGTPTPG
ncbi:MAG: hypothetical protein RLZZ219_1178 [Cyanobacteriota bacterium]|jgi:predicted Na+-dependent transporter